VLWDTDVWHEANSRVLHKCDSSVRDFAMSRFSKTCQLAGLLCKRALFLEDYFSSRHQEREAANRCHPIS